LLFDTIFIGSKNMTQFWNLPCWVTHSWVTWTVGSSEPHNTSYWVFRSHFGSSGLKWAPQHKLLRFSIHYCHRVLLPFTGFRVYATSWLHCVPRSGSDLIDFVLYLLDSCICNGLLVSGLSVGIWHQHGWRGQQGPRPAVATWLWLGVWWLPRSTSNPADRRCLECFDEFNSQTVSYAIPPFRQQCAGLVRVLNNYIPIDLRSTMAALEWPRRLYVQVASYTEFQRCVAQFGLLEHAPVLTLDQQRAQGTFPVRM